MTILGKIRARRLEPVLDRYEKIYETPPAAVDEVQLQRLNSAWRASLRRSPWARRLRDVLGAPEVFESWEAYKHCVPIQRKGDLLAILADVTSTKDVHWRATGGTTSEPLRFPVYPDEARIAGLDLWSYRRWLGIRPDEPLFLVWGHHQMLGEGVKGKIARARRVISDKMLGYTRWSAFRSSSQELDEAGDALVSSRAKYVVGYASALDRIARANRTRAANIKRRGLHAVIATAEGFPKSDSRDVIAECFGCPVVMEYGSNETGPIAYEKPEGGYQVFWPHHRIESIASPSAIGKRELVVTCLFPRALPLLRYAIGDLLLTRPADADCKMGFDGIQGRCNDVVASTNGTLIHSEAFTYAVREITEIRSYQVVKNNKGLAVCLRYEADSPLVPQTVAEIQNRLGRLDPALAALPVELSSRIQKSIVGKSLVVVEE